MQFAKITKRAVVGATLFVLMGVQLFAAEFDERQARSTAVALNYCRASFHRLRTNPSKRVLLEEQQNILNNLNLNGIADQEVITLYSAVLDEVGRERIAEKERIVLTRTHRHAVRRQALSTAFIVGAELTGMQYYNAIRSGANSWWDYRNSVLNHELDLWKVEKTRMLEVVDKSSKFLDTFWKMAQKKNIPDSWLVRGDDLDRLESALTETNLETRLRVLQRMERFMTCYPPYWYHVARTQQALGQMLPASETYTKLAALGDGHFRKDDMLAAGLANRAAIEAYLQNPHAPETAEKALAYSTGVWQANLVCATILMHNGKAVEAEEAILRNLDVDLERNQSLTSLIGLYRETGNQEKLVSYLSDPQVVTELPAVMLLQTAATLGIRKLPPPAFQQLVTSLYAYDQASFGRSQLICLAAPTWGLDGAEATLVGPGTDRPDQRGMSSRGQTQLVFTSPRSVTVGPDGEPVVVMEVRYSDSAPIRLHLKRMAWTNEMLGHVEAQSGRSYEMRDFLPFNSGGFAANQRRKETFVITEVEFQERKLSLWNPAADGPVPSKGPVLVDQKRPAPTNVGSTPTRANPVTIESVSPLPKPDPVPEEEPEPPPEKPNPVTSLPIFRALQPVRLGDKIETDD